MLVAKILQRLNDAIGILIRFRGFLRNFIEIRIPGEIGVQKPAMNRRGNQVILRRRIVLRRNMVKEALIKVAPTKRPPNIFVLQVSQVKEKLRNVLFHAQPLAVCRRLIAVPKGQIAR